MTDDARKSWQGYACRLTHRHLYALLRALRSRSGMIDVSGGPLLYALMVGSDLSATEARDKESEIQADGERCMGWHDATAWHSWWRGTPHAERCDALAAEVEAELDRRALRTGAGAN